MVGVRFRLKALKLALSQEKAAMRNDLSETQGYSAAEKFLCAEAGPVLAYICDRAKLKFGIAIRELRITFVEDPATEEWAGAKCTIVR